MTSSESFNTMEEFANQVHDRSIKIALLGSLAGKEPFAHFNALIHNLSKYRDQWFAFKKEKMMDWLKGELGPSFR